jgi:hypothetical protein
MTTGSHLSARHRMGEAERAPVGRWWAVGSWAARLVKQLGHGELAGWACEKAGPEEKGGREKKNLLAILQKISQN